MLRFIKRGVLTLLPAALFLLAFGAAPAAPDVTAQNVSLACNDGTNLALALDAAGLTQLADAVSAINLYPAGDPALTCGLSQPAAAPADPSSPGQDVAVGGGQILFSDFGACLGGPGPAPINFSLSAHVPTGTPVTPGTAQLGAGGTFNASAPESTAIACGTQQQRFVAKVDCLQVSANSPPGTADLTATVTQSQGAGTFPVGTELSVSVADSGTNVGDMLGDRSTDSPCSFDSTASIPISHGNITVRSGS
jgi:hypothetical protein